MGEKRKFDSGRFKRLHGYFVPYPTTPNSAGIYRFEESRFGFAESGLWNRSGIVHGPVIAEALLVCRSAMQRFHLGLLVFFCNVTIWMGCSMAK